MRSVSSTYGANRRVSKSAITMPSQGQTCEQANLGLFARPATYAESLVNDLVRDAPPSGWA